MRSNVGSARRAQGNHEQARRYFETALEIYEEFGDRAGTAMALIELGIVLYHLGDFLAGEQTLQEAVTLYEEFREPMGMAGQPAENSLPC